jgi:DNA-binding CsgD family transcriptional regulator
MSLDPRSRLPEMHNTFARCHALAEIAGDLARQSSAWRRQPAGTWDIRRLVPLTRGGSLPEGGASWRATESSPTTAWQHAAETCDAIGLEPLGAELHALARRGRIKLGEGEPARSSANPVELLGLTHRELEVLPLLAEGRTNRQIAGQRYITEKTAERHVSRILGKLGVRTRGEAGAVAHRLVLDTAANAQSQPTRGRAPSVGGRRGGIPDAPTAGKIDPTTRSSPIGRQATGGTR